VKASNISDIFISSLKESVGIILIVFVLMLLIEVAVIKYKHILIRLSEKNSFLAYIISSVFGIIPNCSTTFAMDTLYMTGLLSFGGLIAVMISTVDDVGLLVFSKAIEGNLSVLIVLIYFVLLLILGISGGKIADFVSAKLKWKFKIKCDIVRHETVRFTLPHFIKEHIYEHIIRKHIWKIFLWMFITLFIIGLFPDIFSLGSLMKVNKVYLLLLAALIGLIPSPAPNFLIFNIFALHPATMFSVFLTNSIVQDGHGLLPILGYSFKDAVKVKVFKLIFGIIVGLAVMSIGY
jgi:hypothetical protein